MNREFAILFLIFNILMASFSQVLLKKEALKTHNSRIKELLNFNVVLAYFIFFSITIVNILLYKHLDFGLIMIVESISYIFVSVLAFIFFKETLNKKQLLGILFIGIGIIIYTL